jgi:hypothetical protein
MRALTLDDLGSIGKACFHVLWGQFRVGSKEIIQVRVMGEVGKDTLDRYPCPSDHGFPRHDLGIFRDALGSGRFFFSLHRYLLLE